MFLLIELDLDTDWGIDILPPHIFGIRLGFFAVHVVFAKFNESFTPKENETNS